jgi:hypothetical protein
MKAELAAVTGFYEVLRLEHRAAVAADFLRSNTEKVVHFLVGFMK